MSIDPVDLAKALIAAPSVTPATGAVFDVLEAALTPLGFTVERFIDGIEPDGPVENLLAVPLSALDALVRVQLRDEIRRLQLAEGITTLFVTHDQSEALAVADRVAVLNAGKLEQVDVPQVVYTKPATPFVAEFVGTMNEVPVEGGRIVPGAPVQQVRPESLTVGVVPGGVEATVLTSTFLGPVTRLVVTTSFGELTVDVVSRPDLPGIGEATTVGLN